ncbi:hypothetical protein TNCV_1741641 [Trichonephila clavipes]|uniref:Uncharacterized protein n=1 Tax=Trichonephila clavipes TaxID=2585209 RepID=A0A8X6RHA8_TRICX|nr:hypothetical protein TNCV_1741641 [Trichonephila clavipes]
MFFDDKATILPFRVTIGQAENYDTAAHIIFPLPCLTVGRRRSRSYLCMNPPIVCPSCCNENGNIKYCHTHNLLQVPIAELAERWTELPQVSDESRSFFRGHTGYFSNIPKCIKAEFIASWACSQSSVVSSSKR